jgi:uncharacterized protein YdeI (YjbR/CyaY-like superfamily)
MPTLDPRVDAYIAQAQPFARPVLERIRADLHAACPELVETVKWSHPSFTLNGKILAGMAAFKAHCSLFFWKREGAAPGEHGGGMGDFGKLAAPEDLPSPAELRRRAKAAAALLRAGAPRAAAKKAPRAPLVLPDDFAQALAATAAAQAQFEAFPPGKRREYIEWVNEAKRAETRAKRLAQAIEWIAEGKARNWKYEAC